MQGHEHKVSFAPQPTAASPFGDADNLPPLPRKPAPQPSGQLSQQLSSKLGKGSKWNHNTSIAVDELVACGSVAIDEAMAKRIRDADKDKSGTLNVKELFEVFKSELQARSRARLFKRWAIGLVVACLVLLGVNAATTFVIVSLTKDTSTGQDGVMVVKTDATTPVVTGNMHSELDTTSFWTLTSDSQALVNLQRIEWTDDAGRSLSYGVCGTSVDWSNQTVQIMTCVGVPLTFSSAGLEESASASAGGRRRLLMTQVAPTSITAIATAASVSTTASPTPIPPLTGIWKTREGAHAASGALNTLLNAKSNAALQTLFNQWKGLHGKKYSSVNEHNQRLAQFKSNMKDIVNINNPGNSFWAAPNEYSDLSFAEFSQKNLGFHSSDVPAAGAVEILQPPSNRKLMSLQAPYVPTLDWAAQGMTTPIKNQGSCNACWAFASIGAFEARSKIATGKDISFSEQQLIECATGSAGCNGGTVTSAFNYFKASGLPLQSGNPFLGTNGACPATNTTILYTENTSGAPFSYKAVAANSGYQLMIATISQPVVITYTVDAGFQSYKGGIYSSKTCTGAVNHAMVVVGYDYNNRFFKLRNSWGTAWGQAGYAQVYMNDDGTAGMCNMYQAGGWYPYAIKSM